MMSYRLNLLSTIIAIIAQASITLANTEKVIFLGPAPFQIPTAHPTLDDLHIHTLTPNLRTLRTYLRAEFPTNPTKYGLATWLLLDMLSEGQRYEVRVCWAATQPTSFRLETYELQSVFSTPGLITSLAEYSTTRQSDPTAGETHEEGALQDVATASTQETTSSMLFLRILAAADYYTMNRTLMENVPLVYVDIILDPFILNIFPQSLLPTAAYVIIVAIAAWFLSRAIGTWIQGLAKLDEDQRKKKS